MSDVTVTVRGLDSNGNAIAQAADSATFTPPAGGGSSVPGEMGDPGGFPLFTMHRVDVFCNAAGVEQSRSSAVSSQFSTEVPGAVLNHDGSGSPLSANHSTTETYSHPDYQQFGFSFVSGQPTTSYGVAQRQVYAQYGRVHWYTNPGYLSGNYGDGTPSGYIPTNAPQGCEPGPNSGGASTNRGSAHVSHPGNYHQHTSYGSGELLFSWRNHWDTLRATISTGNKTAGSHYTMYFFHVPLGTRVWVTPSMPECPYIDDEDD